MSNPIDVVYERQWNPLVNLIPALIQLKRMGAFYGGFPKIRYTRAGIPSELIKTFPVASVWNLLAGKAKLPKALALNEPRWIGEWVARQKNLAPTVWANGTAHRFLFAALKERGHRLILERGSMHPVDYFLLPQRARKEAGYPYTLDLPAHVAEEERATKLADAIIACSDCVRQSYIQRGYSPDQVLDGLFGINTGAFPLINRQPAGGRPIRMGIVGVIGFRKGLFRLLKIGDWAARKGIALELHFAGPIQDPEAHGMFAKSQATCVLHGVIKGQRLLDMLSTCDLYALPSYEEGLPYSVLEAMSTGLAALVSNDTGAREPVQHGKSGLVLHRFDNDEFDSELEPILRDPQRILEMGRAAHERILENFTFDHYCQRIAKALEVIDKH